MLSKVDKRKLPNKEYYAWKITRLNEKMLYKKIQI